MSLLDFGVRSGATPISTSTQGVQFNPTFINASPNSSTSGNNDAGQSTATRYTEAPVKGPAQQSAGNEIEGFTGYDASMPVASHSLREATPNFLGVPSLGSQFQAAQSPGAGGLPSGFLFPMLAIGGAVLLVLFLRK